MEMDAPAKPGKKANAKQNQKQNTDFFSGLL